MKRRHNKNKHRSGNKKQENKRKTVFPPETIGR